MFNFLTNTTCKAFLVLGFQRLREQLLYYTIECRDTHKHQRRKHSLAIAAISGMINDK